MRHKFDIRRKWRRAFKRVVETHNHIRSIMGSAGAMDYSRITGGQGAQNATDKGYLFKAIDFTADTWFAVAETMTPDEVEFFVRCIQDTPQDYTIQSTEFLRYQEKLGRAFIARGLYPVTSYFTTVKK